MIFIKPFEMYLIYWYADYLILNIIEHLENRVSQILLGKINHLETNIPKKSKIERDLKRSIKGNQFI